VIGGGTGSLTLDNAHLSSCRVCVDAGSATGTIAIANSSLRGGSNLDAPNVGLIAPSLKMRNTLVSDNDTGIVVTGPSANLGAASDPGNNTISNNLITGVKIDALRSLVLAEGNTWEPNAQGAAATGHYPPSRCWSTGLSPLAAGRNFDVRQSSAPDQTDGSSSAPAPRSERSGSARAPWPPGRAGRRAGS
jgi:Protein of unknown function (DUF1565)